MNKWIFNEPFFEGHRAYPKLNQLPWAGHQRFGYDLVCRLKPNVVVELGTHVGCSFYAFCQAVKDMGWDTELHAVDHWQGDSQAGFYGEEIYEQFVGIKNSAYSDLNIYLHRQDFDECRREMEGRTIDLLHIDGFHTYEAVRHDFETWLPLMSPQGIVLFHDTSAEMDYGSRKYWIELKRKYPTFEFGHSCGLGVLALDQAVFDSVFGEGSFIENSWIYASRNREDQMERRRARDVEAIRIDLKSILDASLWNKVLRVLGRRN
jgi:predicted O-methyltransferase YrrM